VNTTTLVTNYYLTDALGSARQLTNGQGEVTLANAYEPYGSVSQSAGDNRVIPTSNPRKPANRISKFCADD
jgi:hypothetical protein